MNVISESSAARRRRRREQGFTEYHGNKYRRNVENNTKSLQFEIDPESTTDAGKEKLQDVGRKIVTESNSILENVTSEIQRSDPTASVEASIAVARPPTPPPTPERPVTIAEKLNIAEIQPGESVSDFLEKVQSSIDVPLDSLVTAEQQQQAKQELTDRQLAPDIRQVPVSLELVEQPQSKQILNSRFFEVKILET